MLMATQLIYLIKSNQNSERFYKLALYLLLIILNLSQVQTAWAQAPYQAIFTDSLYYYEGEEWLPVFFDSSMISGTDTVYYPYRENRKSNGLPGTCVVDSRSSSWLGDSIRIRQNGENLFYNQAGEAISLRTSVGYGYKYHLYDFPNGNYIEVTNTGGKLETVFDVSDFTKTFTMQAWSPSTGQIAHPMNGKTWKLSLNYGLIKAYSFRDFPNDTASILPGGMPFRKKGKDRLNAKRIYDIMTGYELHFITQEEKCGFPGCRQDSILESRFLIVRDSVSPDTLLLHWKRALIDYYNDPIIGTGVDTRKDTIVDTILFSQLRFLDTMSRQLFHEADDWGYNITYRSDSTGLGFAKQPFSGFDYDSIGHCLSPKSGQSMLPTRIFGEGLGEIYNYKLIPGIGYEKSKLVYYQQGIPTWGTPLDFTILGMEGKQPINSLLVFPNPSHGQIRVMLSKEAQTLRITDLQGHLIKENALSHDQEFIDLNLSDSPDGLYLLEMQGKNAFSYSTLILQ